MKLINYPKRAVEFTNLNAGDIILADTLEPSDKFFLDRRKTRYCTYVVESSNKVNSAIIVAAGLTPNQTRNILTKDGDTCTIEPIAGEWRTLITNKVWHYTPEEEAVMHIFERADAQEDLRRYVDNTDSHGGPRRLQFMMDEIYERCTGDKGHEATCIADPHIARETMNQIIAEATACARNFLAEDLKEIDKHITAANQARKEISDIANTLVAPLSPNSEALTITDTKTHGSVYTTTESCTYRTGTAITHEGVDYLITRIGDNKAYVTVAGEGQEAGYLSYTVDDKTTLHLNSGEVHTYVKTKGAINATSAEDIANYHTASEKATEIFNTLESSLQFRRNDNIHHPIQYGNPISDVGMNDYTDKTARQALELITDRVSQLKVGLNFLARQGENYISGLNYYNELAHGE